MTSMTNFDRAFVELLGHEGGYSNDPKDPGGETNWGITVAVARENGYVGAMKDMDQSVAKQIYAKKYWIPAFDLLPYALAFQVFDGAVNSSVAQSVRWLQRAVDFAGDGDLGDLADDGDLGPITLKATQAAELRSVIMLYNAERLMFMTKLSNWPHASKGWSRRISNNLRKGAR